MPPQVVTNKVVYRIGSIPPLMNVFSWEWDGISFCSVLTLQSLVLLVQRLCPLDLNPARIGEEFS